MMIDNIPILGESSMTHKVINRKLIPNYNANIFFAIFFKIYLDELVQCLLSIRRLSISVLNNFYLINQIFL